MPRSGAYLNSDLLNLADSTQLKNQMDTDIWQLGWPETVKSGIDSLTSFAQAITPPENPLPIVTSPRPQVQPIQSLDEMERMWGSGNGDVQDTQSSGPDPSAGPAPASAPAAAPSAAGAPSLPQGTIDNSSRESFVRTAYPYMLQAAGGNKDAAEMMLAAAISENGSVGTGKPFFANNFFGIKGRGDAGSTNAATWEQTANGPVNINDNFAAYSSPQAGFRAFFDFLQQNPRYAPALAAYQKTGDAQQLFADVNAAGYATDPQWASKVASIRVNQVAPVTQALQARAAQTSEVPSGQASAPRQSGGLDVNGIVQAYKDTSYTYGGPGGRTAGFGAPSDCSGFVAAVFKHQYGLDLVPHTDGAYNQLRQSGAPEVSVKDARPGDVVFYMGAGTGGAITHHMGIYAGNGQVLDDSVSGADGVRVRDIGHAGQYVILRDPRLNPQAPQSASTPPPIAQAGVAEQTGGARLSQRQIDAASQEAAAGPSPVAVVPSSAPAAAPSAAGAPDLMLRRPLDATAQVYRPSDSPPPPEPEGVAQPSPEGYNVGPNPVLPPPVNPENVDPETGVRRIDAPMSPLSPLPPWEASDYGPGNYWEHQRDITARQSYRNPLTPTSGSDTFPTDVSSAQSGTSAPLPPWEATSPPPAGISPNGTTSVSVSGAVPAPAPAGAPTAGAFQDDYSQSGWVQPGMAPGPPVPDMRGTSNPTPIAPPPAPRFNPLAGNTQPVQPGELPTPAQPATKPMLPLYDASMNVVGYVQNQATPSPSTVEQANAYSAEASGMRPSEMQPGGLPEFIASQFIDPQQQMAARWRELAMKLDRTPEEDQEMREIGAYMELNAIPEGPKGRFTGPDENAVAPITSRIGSAVNDLRGRFATGSERAAATEAERAAAGQQPATAYGTLGMVPPERGPKGRPIPGQQPIKMTPEQEVARLRLDKFPEELRGPIQQAAEATGFAHDARRGVIPDAAAEQAADRMGLSADDWIKRSRVGKALNTEETRALRNVMTGQAQKVSDLARQITEAEANGVTTNLLIVQAHQEAEKLAGLVQYMEGARAEAGRALRAWQQETRPTDPGTAAQRVFKKFGGDRQLAIDAMKEFQQIPPDDPIAQANFWARVERGGKISNTDILTAIRYNSMLSSPRTWEVGWIGSMMQAPFKAASDIMAAATRPTSGELPAALHGSLVGFQRGLQPMLETIQHGITSEQAAGGALPKGLAARATSPLGRFFGTAVDLPGRMVAAPDALFSSVFRQAELGRQAAIQAYKQGLKGEQRAQFMLDFITNPPKSMDDQITRTVDRMMLRGDMGTLGNVVGSFGKNVPGGELYKSLILPFMKVAYHVWTQGVEMTPVGTAGMAFDAARGALGHGPYAEGFGAGAEAAHVRPLAERLRYNLLGLGVTGYALSQAFADNVSGAGPDDPNQKRMLRDKGWQPYSVRMPDGRWYSYSNWGPVAVPLASAAAIAENQRYRKPDSTTEKDMLDMASRVGKLVGDQSFLSGIGTLVNAYQEPDRYLPQFAANMATSFIPYGSAFNVAGQATDETQRRPDRLQDIGPGQYLEQSISSRLPGLREGVPAAQGALGQAVPNDQTGLSALEPFRFTTAREQPIIDAFLNANVNIPQPRDQITFAGAKLDMTAEERRRWNELRGDALVSGMAPYIQNGALDRMPPAIRERILQQQLDRAGQQADLKLATEMDPKDRARRLQDAIKARYQQKAS